MSNIWKKNQDVNEHPNRNNFDLKYQNHLTMKMGYLYPIMCKEVVPGDSFEIDTAFGLKFMPLVFPVQSRMRAHVHYFYVRNKNLWENWENFISGLEQHTHPYIDQPSSFFRSGSLSDYLDVPTTVCGVDELLVGYMSDKKGYGIFDPDNLPDTLPILHPITDVVSNNSGFADVDIPASFLKSYNFVDTSFASGDSWNSHVDVIAASPTHVLYEFDKSLPSNMLHYKDLDSSTHLHFAVNNPIQISGGSYVGGDRLIFWYRPKNHDSVFPNTSLGSSVFHQPYRCLTFFEVNLVDSDYTSGYEVTLADVLMDGDRYNQTIDVINGQLYQEDYENYEFVATLAVTSADAVALGLPDAHEYVDKTGTQFSGKFFVPQKVDFVTDSSNLITPFGNDSTDKGAYLGISALPYRAYESVYRAYYQNTQNQPFIVNGQPVYNKYNTTLADGADSTNYHLFRRNYELDYLTSGMPSPQFGVAPLVGMTALGNITIEDDSGITTAHAEIDDDGTITKVVLTSPAASVDHARTAMNIASCGMSINDFRNTNALQKFLETTLRKGYKYRDFIAGHFGKEPEYRELDMPEFIGGVSEQVQVNMISNMTAGVENNPLGSFAGTANCFGQAKHKVHHYCDDYGFIIGIMCVVPDPAYSQLLPKHYLHKEQLDYYFPEFSQLGMQPITYKEVCPVQAYQDYISDNNKLLTDTFCYQRPNYDLVGYTDQVHGLFRTDLRDFLVNRVFAERPELGSEFLEINPKEVNDIFAYTDTDADTIVGQVVIDIKAKRPVPRVTIPSLGR